MHPAPILSGTQDLSRFSGTTLAGLAMQYVYALAFRKMPPVPAAAIPARLARAEQVFADKLWREQLREWDEKVKPASITKHREIQSVDPDALSDDELVAYLRRCAEHHAAMITQHMRFTAGAMLPT